MHLNLSADEVLSTTRAVRKRLDFDRPVSREVIEECLQLALQAPTGSNSQGWQWVFVTDPAKKKALADIYATNFAEYAKFAQSNSYEEGDLRHEQRDRVTSSAMLRPPPSERWRSSSILPSSSAIGFSNSRNVGMA